MEQANFRPGGAPAEQTEDTNGRPGGNFDQSIERQAYRREPDTAEKLHVTVKFFGEVDAVRLSALDTALARAAAAAAPCELTLAGTGAFPAAQNPRVLWLGIQDPTGRLASRRG